MLSIPQLCVCSCSVYHSIVLNEMSIGFTKLGSKRCEICLAHNTAPGHNHDRSEMSDDCSGRDAL